MAKIPEVSNVETDISTQLCSFDVEKSLPLDKLKSQLQEFSEDNTHMADWTLVE